MSPVTASSRMGLFPARAGEPPLNQPQGSIEAVYPRACGGTSPSIIDISEVIGLSPRVRGNPYLHALPQPVHGSIPARAGEPVPPCVAAACARVYPRACGGTISSP